MVDNILEYQSVSPIRTISSVYNINFYDIYDDDDGDYIEIAFL